MAQLIIAAAGVAITAAFPGIGGAIASFAFTSIGNAIFAPTQKSQGPRLGDKRVSGTEYGDTIPVVFGHPRLAGQVVWASDLREIKTTTEAGKGTSSEYSSYTYEVDLLYLLADNELQGVSRIWLNGKLVWSVLAGTPLASIAASARTEYWTNFSFYSGSSSQLPDPIYEAAVGLTNACAYRGRSTIMIEGLQLGSSGQIPNLTFEMYAAGTVTANISKVLDIPYTIDNRDVGYYNQTPAVNNPGYLTYSTGYGVFGNSGSVTFQGTTNQYTLADSGGTSRKFTAEIEVISTAIVTNGGTGTARQILTMNASGIGAAFVAYVQSGVLTIGCGVTNGTTSTTYHGALSTGVYKIVLNETAGSQINFYRNGVLLRSVAATPNGYNTITVGSSVMGGIASFNQISDMTLNYVRCYLGDYPDLLDTVTPTNPTLESVVSQVCTLAGYGGSEFNASGLAAITKPVRSLALTQVGPARQVLEMLASAYYFDASGLTFVPRGAASAMTIPFDSLGLNEGAAGLDEPLQLKQANDIERPAQVAVSYINADADYTVATEYSDRLLAGQNSTSTVSLPIAFTAAEAKGIADTQVMEGVASFLTTQIAVGTEFAKLVPTDVVTVADSDGSTYRMRVTKREDSGTVLKLDLVSDDATILSNSGTSSSAYLSGTTVTTPADTTVSLMDIPILRDEDNDAGFYVAVKGESSPWPGAVLYKGLDGVTYSQASTLEEQTVIGACTTTLADWTRGNVVDYTNTVTVSVGLGTLASSTRDTVLDSDANACLIGSEVVQFITATLVSAGIYTLSGLVRGRRGTEAFQTGHAASEPFVFLKTAGLRRITISTTEIAALRHYKAVTLGRRLSTAIDQTLTCQAVGLKPFSPVGLRADRTTTDIVLSWDRRTRLACNFTSGVVPLGEASESYDVVIYADNTYAVVKRTLSAVTASATYTIADQTTDFGGAQATVYVDVFQRSAIVGRGYALRGAI